MGYQIKYGATAVKIPVLENTPKKEKNTRPVWLIPVIVTGIIIALGWTGNLDFLIPGDKVVTKKAFSEMVEQVQQGEQIGNAITAFCREILDNAEYADQTN